jgi:DNA (cytosine-5)-methyltransferase 1
MTFGDLFAGIGGLSLGLERAGMICKWQVEKDHFCWRVLLKHWPHIDRWDDVRDFPPGDLETWRVDLICGGFPCQDLSLLGKRRGLGGSRSGLWSEFARVLGVLRPRYAIVENVPGLLSKGFDRILIDLAEVGFDACWSSFFACSVGASHPRERLFVVAYPAGQRFCWDPSGDVREDGQVGGQASLWPGPAQSPVCGVAYGVPHRVDRIKSLGNAVVPQVAEWIGRRIISGSLATTKGEHHVGC